MKDKYPKEAERLLDFYFPKGNENRGKALVILAQSFIEGQANCHCKEIKKILKRR